MNKIPMLIMVGYLNEFPPEYENLLLEWEDDEKFGGGIEWLDRDLTVFEWMNREMER